MEKHWEYHKPMYLAFLDLEKAYKTIERNGRVRNTIRTEESNTIIISKYGTCQSKVRVGACEGEWFETITGIRQGRFLFPLLFVM